MSSMLQRRSCGCGLQEEDASVCDEVRARAYSVVSEQWHLIEHRCERDGSGYVWIVTNVERLGEFVMTIGDAPATATPTPAPAALASPSVFVTRVTTARCAANFAACTRPDSGSHSGANATADSRRKASCRVRLYTNTNADFGSYSCSN